MEGVSFFTAINLDITDELFAAAVTKALLLRCVVFFFRRFFRFFFELLEPGNKLEDSEPGSLMKDISEDRLPVVGNPLKNRMGKN